MSRRRRGAASLAAALGCALASNGLAHAQLPPLPPIGQPPPGQPQPQPQPQPQQPQPPPPAPPGTPALGTVTLHVDIAQTGFLPDDALVPPLQRRWRIDASPSHVLAVDGRVFLAGNELVALDQATGNRLWAAPLDEGSRGAAYDAGIVFVSSFDYINAFSAETGALLWRAKLTDVAFATAPVASGGVVYVYHGQGGGTLHAFRGSDGHKLWSVGAPGGANAPSLDTGRVYVAGACAQTSAFGRSDGKRVWHHDSGCSGGDSVTPALHDGRLWVPENDHVGGTYVEAPILDASNGGVLRRYPPGQPVFVDGLAVLAIGDQGTHAVDPASGREVWRARGALRPLIAVGHDLYGLGGVGDSSERHVVAVDGETGALIWSEELPGNFLESRPSQVVAAAPGLLVVAGGGHVTAYESTFTPPPGGIEIGADRFEAVAGRRAAVVGVLGSQLRGTRPGVSVQAARWRRGRFRQVGEARPSRDGGFVVRARVNRNTRFRAVSRGVTSEPITVYALPSVSLGRPVGSGSRIRVPVAAKAPGARLGGRTLVLYLDRRGDNKGLTRLASSRLHGGRRARGTLVMRPLRRVGRRDTLAFCIRGQLALELGRPSPLTRRCGARRLAQG